MSAAGGGGNGGGGGGGAVPALTGMLKSSSGIGLSALQASVDNPSPQLVLPPPDAAAGTRGDKLCIVMMGLPARGKTFIARRLRQYLRFFHGAKCEYFNVGSYRRRMLGKNHMADFYDPGSTANVAKRQECSQAAMDDMKAWIEEHAGIGTVAIFDATNSTRAKQTWIVEQLETLLESRSHIIFIESICTDAALVEANICAARANMPDYEGITPEEAEADFRKRIAFYERAYEPMEDQALSWVKFIDGGRALSMNRIHGFLPGRILHFLINLHVQPRPIYLSRHGQSQYNVLGKIGGDSSLSPMGHRYAEKLAEWAGELVQQPGKEHTRLWTSTLRRTRETAGHIKHPVVDNWVVMRPRQWHALDEIFAGIFDGMTYEGIEKQAPDEFARRKANKLKYRYPRGESYLDVITRLDPIIHEIERSRDPILVVAHQGILRVIYAYFKGMDREKCPFLKVPLNHVMELLPGTYDCAETITNLLPDDSLDDAPSH